MKTLVLDLFGYSQPGHARDTTEAIAPKHQQKVFQIFSRVQQREDDGSGAGLSFVRRIVEDYGSNIALVSHPGEGTCFYFSLPLDDRPD